MQTRTETLASLYQDGFFDIPSYQRSYSWEEPQLADLIDDLRYLPEESNHFFGNIILDKQDEQYRTDSGRRFDVYDVVDGQQRLTTALILLHVATQYDELVEETVAKDNLIFPIDERPRLMPQDQDSEFFRDSLFGSANLERETPSQERLEHAKEYFESTFEELPSDVSVREISERLRYDCKINVVEIDDNSEAASIFETLNDRGKPLSSLDKTKSFLMYMDDRSSNRGKLEAKIKQRFGSIYRELFVLSNGHDRVSNFSEASFQRFHWGIYDGYDSDEYFNSLDTLKRRLRERYRNADYEAIQAEIDEYTQNLHEAASAFKSLFSPSKRPPDVESALNRLFALGKVANIFPVLMAAQMEYGDDEPSKMVDVIQGCETLVFRMYAVDRRKSDTGRSKLVRLAHSIHADDSYVFEDAVSRIASITRNYTDDDRFERQLRDPDLYRRMSSQDIRYLFYHYGQNLDMKVRENVQRDLEKMLSTSFEVEHILARNVPEEEIPVDLREEFDENVHRIGNLTVASEYWNKNYGNLPFEEKKTASDGREAEYKSSNLRVQRELAEYDKFGHKEIDEREQEIVEFALKEWDIQSENQQPQAATKYDNLPDGFFQQLTNKQEAIIRVLLHEGNWTITEDICEQAEDKHGVSIGGGQAMAGILSGLTQKYSKTFTWNLFDFSSSEAGVKYRLAPDSAYIDDLQERFDSENAT